MPGEHRFRLTVLGRYPSRLEDNQPAITVNLAAGDERGHLVHCGTLTMSESEWRTFADALREGLADRVDVRDPATA